MLLELLIELVATVAGIERIPGPPPYKIARKPLSAAKPKAKSVHDEIKRVSDETATLRERLTGLPGFKRPPLTT